MYKNCKRFSLKKSKYLVSDLCSPGIFLIIFNLGYIYQKFLSMSHSEALEKKRRNTYLLLEKNSLCLLILWQKQTVIRTLSILCGRLSAFVKALEDANNPIFSSRRFSISRFFSLPRNDSLKETFDINFCKIKYYQENALWTQIRKNFFIFLKKGIDKYTLCVIIKSVIITVIDK